jgi:hypothetical protein
MGAYANANEDIAGARREILARTAAERRRRHIVRLLDVAIDQCERRNLTAPGAMLERRELRPPGLAVALIESLQWELEREARPPRSNQEALDMLFGLQRAFLPCSDDDDDDAQPVRRRYADVTPINR